MQAKHLFFAIVFLLACFGVSFSENSTAGTAQEKRVFTITESEFQALMKKMDAMQHEIDSLKTQINSNESRPDGISPLSSDNEKHTQKMPVAEQISEPQSPSAPDGFGKNPKISVSGDLLWNINNNPNVEGDSPLQVREVEFSFQDHITPWAKADISAGLVKEEGHYHFELEEAYLTFSQLPLSLQARVGQTKLPFGKDNAMHQHALPYVDRPDVIHNFFGPEGQKGIGAELSGIIPMGNVYAELTGAAVKTLPSDSFEENQTGKPAYLGKIRLFSDLNENNNLELGYSYLTGYNDPESYYKTTLQGADLTYRWQPAQKDNQSLVLRSEYIWNKRIDADQTVNSNGYYLFGQYQFHRNWYVGARYDYAQYANSSTESQRSYSGILTYAPTESLYYRLQYKDILPHNQPRQNQWLFQINFTMGSHQENPYCCPHHDH